MLQPFVREHGKMAKASGHIKRFAFNVAQATSPNALTSLIAGRDRSFMFNAIGARAALPGRFFAAGRAEPPADSVNWETLMYLPP